jgi:hypothetical protein
MMIVEQMLKNAQTPLLHIAVGYMSRFALQNVSNYRCRLWQTCLYTVLGVVASTTLNTKDKTFLF